MKRLLIWTATGYRKALPVSIQSRSSSNPLAPTLMTFTASDYIIIYLPLWVAVIGIFGIVLLVINANREPEIRRIGV